MDPLLKGLTVTLDPQQEIAVMLKTLITRPTLEQVIHLTNPEANNLTPAQLQSEVVRLQNKISISQLEAKNYYEISYTDRDSSTAATVAEALLSILQNNRVGNTRLNMDDARSFINRQIAEYEARLREADKRREDFKTANIDILGKDNAGNRIDVADTAYEQASKDYNSAVARRDSVRAQLDNTPKNIAADQRIFLGPTIGAQFATMGAATPRLLSSTQRLQQAEDNLEELRSKYTDDHPDVIAAKKLVDQLQAEISGMPKTSEPDAPAQPVMIPNPAYVQLQAKLSEEEANVAVQRQRLAGADSDLQNAKREATKAVETLTKYNELDRDYGNVESTYRQLLQSRESAALSQARDDQNEALSFRVLEPPQKPQFPAGPNRVILNSLVLILGAGGGIGAAVLLMLNASCLITANDLALSFSVPILGLVTQLRGPAKLQNRAATLVLAIGAVLLLVVYGAVLVFVSSSVVSINYAAVITSLKSAIHSVLGARHV
jgi:polysaccharide chain length determinant protein (PEP-CTERM system associated)